MIGQRLFTHGLSNFFTHGLSIFSVLAALGLSTVTFATQQTSTPADAPREISSETTAENPQQPNADAAGAIGELNRAYTASAQEGLKVAGNMRNVERIQIRVPGMATISGEYRLSGDGAIALPGLGRLQVGAGTVQGLEAQIAAEIQRLTNQEASVAVEVIEYKPIFVSGMVGRSGSYPWKPGYSVLHAEALAGGLFRGPLTDGAANPLTRTRDDERERAVRAAYELAATIATMERLRTEINKDTTYILPDRVTSLVSKTEQHSLLAAQQATLDSRLSLHNAKLAAAEGAIAIAASEQKAFDEQVERIRDQLTKRRAIVKKVEYMTTNNFARGDRLFDEQVRVAELEERLTTTILAKTRAEVAGRAAAQQLENLNLTWKAEHDMELLALEQKKADFEILIESANSVYRRATGQDAIASRIAEPLTAQYEIVRADGGKSSVIKADRSTPLLPGDVVVVSLGRPEANLSGVVKDQKAELEMAR